MASTEDASSHLLSVIIPVYNRRELVLRAIDSVLNQQTGHALEVLVVDDGSSDGTAAAVGQRFAGDTRVRLIEADHGGASAARNHGLHRSRGDRLSFLDSDDYWLPGMLAAIEMVFARHPQLGFVCVDGATLGTTLQPIQPRIVAGNSPGWSHAQFHRAHLAQERIKLPGSEARLQYGDYFPAIVFGDLFYLSGMVMRRESVVAAGPFNERFRYFNDWEFFARLCLATHGAYLDVDGFRRDTGRADQISRRRPATALARRQLYIVRTLQRRAVSRSQDTLALAFADACYGMGRALQDSTHRHWARRYLRFCLRHRYKFFRSLARLLGSRP